MGMTWNEFKEAVDKALAEKGANGDLSIWYIDVSFPETDGIHVGIDDNCGMMIGG